LTAAPPAPPKLPVAPPAPPKLPTAGTAPPAKAAISSGISTGLLDAIRNPDVKLKAVDKTVQAEPEDNSDDMLSVLVRALNERRQGMREGVQQEEDDEDNELIWAD